MIFIRKRENLYCYRCCGEVYQKLPKQIYLYNVRTCHKLPTASCPLAHALARYNI